VRLALQVLVYPATDLTGSMPSHKLLGDGYLLTRRMTGWFMSHYFHGADRRNPDASPLYREDVSGVAPALVYTAGFDPLRDEGKAYADKLSAAGFRVKYQEFESLVHGFAQMAGVIDAARGALNAIGDEVATELR
jgi:acetyl esterase